MNYNKRIRWILVLFTVLLIVCHVTLMMRSHDVHINGRNDRHGASKLCDCREEEAGVTHEAGVTKEAGVTHTFTHVEGRAGIHDTPAMRSLSEEVTKKKWYNLTLISEDSNTVHIWPWAGQKLRGICENFNWYKLGKLPTISVIITFIDHESLTALLRTIQSVIQYTPAHLLLEVILVEDNCKRDELHSVLDAYVDMVFKQKVHFIRNNHTLGLIKARLQGIRAASGDVIVCMDSHVEVQRNWIEPLLYEIKSNRKTLATSYLDWMEMKDEKWQIKHGGSNWKTYFDMELIFGFQEISKKTTALQDSIITAVDSPVTVGTIWAMNKKYFQEVGEFDEGMELWGGENLDLPIRVWLMGGRVVNVPCSHTVHLEKQGYRDYRLKWAPAIHKNYKRFIAVWMEEYLPYFDLYFPDFKNIDTGDLSSRMALRKKAKYTFRWYLENIFPELGIPQLHGTAWGKIKNFGNRQCLVDNGYKLQLSQCRHQPPMIFFLDKETRELRSTIHVYNVKFSEKAAVVRKTEYIPNYNMSRTTMWSHYKDGPLKVRLKDWCLEAKLYNIIVAKCDFSNENQNWHFDVYES